MAQAAQEGGAATGRAARELILDVHADARGDVRETYRESWAGSPVRQMVRSYSRAGTLRAMHAHKRQTDIWTFVGGRALVQLYDHLTGYHRVLVLEQDMTLVIPPGIAHGFYALEECLLVYGLTEEYDGSDEYQFNAFDPNFPGADMWPGPPAHPGYYVRSERDRSAPTLAEYAAAW